MPDRSELNVDCGCLEVKMASANMRVTMTVVAIALTISVIGSLALR